MMMLSPRPPLQPLSPPVHSVMNECKHVAKGAPPRGLIRLRGINGMTASAPNGWERHINPAEGRPYFRNSALHIVTECFILDDKILQQVEHWGKLIAPFVQDLKIDYEIALNVGTNGENKDACSYYLVDYTAQLIFWLRDVTTPNLQLPAIRNPTHLKHLLSEQFWIHCEYMPPPHQDFTPHAKALLATLGTLSIDASTSTGSVSPFHQDECESYSKALAQVLETGGNIEVNWCLARIMSLLLQSRVINLYGEQNSRTDRTMVVNGQYAPAPSAHFRRWSIILFGTPTLYLNRWNTIWVDRVTYTREWRKLVKEITEEWVSGMAALGVMLIAGVVLIVLTPSPIGRLFATCTALLSIGGGAYTMLLLSQHRMLGTCAADAANFIQQHETSKSGLQALALRHGIPWGSVLWCAMFLFLSIGSIVIQDVIRVIYPVVRANARSMMVPALMLVTYLYGRGVLSMPRLHPTHAPR